MTSSRRLVAITVFVAALSGSATAQTLSAAKMPSHSVNAQPARSAEILSHAAQAQPMSSAEMLSHSAHIKNYNGLITDEVARQRIRKLGYSPVATAPPLEARRLAAGKASDVIAAGALQMTAEKNGRTHHLQVDRVTGAVREID